MRARSAARLLLLTLPVALASVPGFATAQEAPPASDPAPSGPEILRGAGFASIAFKGLGGRQTVQNGLSLEVRVRNRITPRFGADVTVTWGLTDWDRAKEWIDAGNASGRWTTDHIQSVTRWVEEGGDSTPIRFMGAIFADMFLVATYAAVPFCYAGSVGGATSHLQLDVTGTVRTGGAVDLFAEGGIGVAGLPEKFVVWEYAAGPVVGVGVDAGPIRLGGRLLWAPPALTSTERAPKGVLIGSATVAARF